MVKCGWVSALHSALVTLLLVIPTVSNAASGRKFSCGHVREGLKDSSLDLTKLIPTMSAPSVSGSICGGSVYGDRSETCCDSGLETQFLKTASDQFAQMLRNANDKLLGLITGHLDVIRERIRASFQVTNVGVQQMLNETYPEVGKRLRQPLEKMFMQLQTILASPSVEAITVESVVEDFFNAHLFPQLYLCAVRDCRGGDSLSSPYTNCLAKLVNSTVSNYHHQSSLAVMEPSGTLNGPRLLNDLLFELKAQLRNAIETVRLYMNGLELAADIVKKSSHSRSPTTFLSSSCQKALARLKFCRFCGRAEDVLIQTSNNSSEFDNGWIETPRSYGMGTGEPVPICRNFCLNVVSGCLSPFISPIETQWDGLLRELKMFSYLLANGNSHWDLEMVLAKADVTLQRIVEKAYEDKLQLMTLVEERCGPAEIIPNSVLERKKEPFDDLNKRVNIRSTDLTLFSYFETVMSNLTQDYVGWFAKFPVEMCDVGFAKDGDCWDGERVGRYSKDLVILGQTNPEVSGSDKRDPASVAIAEKFEFLQKKLQEFPSVKSPRAHSQRQENRRKPAAPPVEFPKTQNVESDIDDIEEKEGWFSGDDESFSTKSDTLSDDEDLDLGSGSGDEPDMNLSGHPGFHPLQGVTRRPTTPDGLTEPWDVSMPPGRSDNSDSRNAIQTTPRSSTSSAVSTSSFFGSSRVSVAVVSLLSLSVWLRLTGND